MINRKLIIARERKGWSQAHLAELANTTPLTVSRWENGRQRPRPSQVSRLCQIFNMRDRELGLTNLQNATHQESSSMTYEVWDGCFSFGRLKTTSVVLDGDGTSAYLPANIYTYVDPVPATFFPEVLQAKEQIQEEELRQHGKQWNSEKYHISKIGISREPPYEDMVLSLTFKPRDHYTGLATRRCLDDPAFRRKYIPEDWDWTNPIVGMSMSMGVDMAVISSDGHILLTQRGQNVSVHQGAYNCSVSEAVSPLLDRSSSGPGPDFYRTASRGFAEELGLSENVDFTTGDIAFFSFTVDTHYALYGLRGMVKVNKTAEEILRKWHTGVKDKIENSKIFSIPFTPEDVCAFVFSREPWASGLICIYHSLVHEFGHEHVDRVIDSF